MSEATHETWHALLGKLGGPAHPLTVTDLDGEHVFAGLTVRDYFAGQALMGYLSGRNWGDRDSHHVAVAEACYKYADAMLVVRKQNDQTP